MKPLLATVENRTNSSVVCSRASRAESLFQRLRGLLGQQSLDAEAGLLITPSSGVHTFGMRFPIDVVALDRQHRVLRVSSNVAPGRICLLPRRTRTVLELQSGRAHACGLAVGHQLALADLDTAQG